MGDGDAPPDSGLALEELLEDEMDDLDEVVDSYATVSDTEHEKKQRLAALRRKHRKTGTMVLARLKEGGESKGGEEGEAASGEGEEGKNGGPHTLALPQGVRFCDLEEEQRQKLARLRREHKQAAIALLERICGEAGVGEEEA